MMHKQLLITAFAAFLALSFVFGVVSPAAREDPVTDPSESTEMTEASSDDTTEGSESVTDSETSVPQITEETEKDEPTAPSIALPTAPDGSKPLLLYINGRAIDGEFCFEYEGRIWLGIDAFCSLFDYDKLDAEEGDCYITSGDRAIPCSKNDAEVKVRKFGVLCAPIEPLLSAAGLKSTEIIGDEICIWGVPTFPDADDVYRYEDLYWLSRIISAEARGEPFVGQLAVGTVVINRTRSSYYPDRIYDVIFDRLGGVQFTPVSSGTVYHAPTESSILAAKLCLEGFSLNDNILFFFNSSIAAGSWITANRTYTMTVGQHDFYS